MCVQTFSSRKHMKKLIKFSTSTCKPCVSIKPVWEELKKEYSSETLEYSPETIEFIEVVCDGYVSDIENMYIDIADVRTVPTISLFSDGKFISKVTGVDVSGRKYRKLIEDNL